MDKLDKLIQVKVEDLFEQWGPSLVDRSTAGGEGWYNGAYAPSVPSRHAVGIDDTIEDEDEDKEEEGIEEQEKEGSYARGFVSDKAMEMRSLEKRLAAKMAAEKAAAAKKKN